MTSTIIIFCLVAIASLFFGYRIGVSVALDVMDDISDLSVLLADMELKAKIMLASETGKEKIHKN